jgi:hypothetical protein
VCINAPGFASDLMQDLYAKYQLPGCLIFPVVENQRRKTELPFLEVNEGGGGFDIIASLETFFVLSIATPYEQGLVI